MKITDSVDIAGAGMQPPDKGREKGPAGRGGEILPKDDQVSLSGQAREIGRLQAEVSKIPDVRADRVENVKNAVNSGAYNVKGEAVAGKILKEVVIDSIVRRTH